MVMHFHGPWSDEAAAEGAGRIGQHLRHRLEREVYRRASRVITLSRAFADYACERYGVAPRCVRVVPGSVDIARLAPSMSRAAARGRLGWPAQARVLLSVRPAGVPHGAGPADRGDAGNLRAIPQTVLMIAGRGPEQAHLQRACRNMRRGHEDPLSGICA